ncbi:NIPSNAP family protein [Rhodococcus sp. NPDC056743]|uniref:NIPSNAP family protein n=1 Tax=Rhodococcus sp. NPDC056743 TaxID=3345934 RepID=UPI00366C1D82
MIYEVRSYQVDAENVTEFERIFGDGYVHRQAFSPLTAFWHTTNEPLSEVVHVWPYIDLDDRASKRAAAAQHPQWPPATGQFVNRMQSELVIPFDFVSDPMPGLLGPIYEIQYDYFKVSDLGAGTEAWTNAIQERSKRDSLVLAGRLEFGQVNGIIQIWAYSDPETRRQAIAKASTQGISPPADCPTPIHRVTKMAVPSIFSPLQ